MQRSECKSRLELSYCLHVILQICAALREIGRRVLLVTWCCDQRCGLECSEGSSHFVGVIVSGLDVVNTRPFAFVFVFVFVSLKDTTFGVFSRETKN